MSLPIRRGLLSAAFAAGAVLSAAPPAHALNEPVGVDSCTVESFGSDVDCTVVITGGYYKLEAWGLDDGLTVTRIGCNPGGDAYDVSAVNTGGYGLHRIYLPSGVCTMRVWAEWHGRGQIVKDG